MIDPNSRFRTSWNICLAFFIIYCGIAVPFEIAFEVDMVNAMCGVGEERLLREDCPSYLQWFWLNFLVDLWFISDIVINFRTGCARAPQSHPLPTRSPPARHAARGEQVACRICAAFDEAQRHTTSPISSKKLHSRCARRA